jgi:hypothetical protein
MPQKHPKDGTGIPPRYIFPRWHRLPRDRAGDRGTLVTSYAPLGYAVAKCIKIRVSYRQSRPRRHQPRPVTLFTHRFGLAMRQIKTGPLRKKESLSAGGTVRPAKAHLLLLRLQLPGKSQCPP